jgi:TonB family protein
MLRSNKVKRLGVSRFTQLVVLSACVHVALIYSLPDREEEAVVKREGRVKARLVTPPKPPPKKIAKVEKVKPPEEKKVEPKVKKEPKKEPKKVEPKKVVKKKKKRLRKKRRPPKTLTSVRKGPAAPEAPTAVVPVAKPGAVTDLGDWDPDATDEETERPFDPDIVDEEEPVAVAEPEVKPDRPKDRKATCKVKADYPNGATAVLPATVSLTVRVLANGSVESATIIGSVEPVLDREARRALLAAKCRPAIKNGVRVAARIPFRVEFK